MMCGIGIKIFSDDMYYIGQHKNNMMNGQGVLTCSDGTRDMGTWKDSLMHGDIIIKYNDGLVLETKFKNGEEIENV